MAWLGPRSFPWMGSGGDHPGAAARAGGALGVLGLGLVVEAVNEVSLSSGEELSSGLLSCAQEGRWVGAQAYFPVSSGRRRWARKGTWGADAQHPAHLSLRERS